MQLQLLFLLALAAATSAAPLVFSADQCGNTDAGRACLIAKDELHHDVAFIVKIGENNINVNEVLVSQDPNFSIIGLELETAFVACTATCILIDADGHQTPCEDIINHGRTLSKPGDELNLSNVQTLVAVDCERVFPPIGH